ncbi:FLYWCH-type domain-containing protein [Aphis craccivora]|uniref:FLYWCH-type domain-containing protein n=1 Tax=Aphis craccivora TaxID=307492 RepID=A0A6G0YVR6_APHCR|nr:FLYWCH-type domain-containing protein [Aphis craccivora]
MDPCTRPKKIILKEISEMEVLPANPKNIAEVHETLNNINTNTKQGEPFLLINDEEKHIIIVTCESNMRFLCEIDDLYMDGTFKYAASFFMQMFTIHGIKNGHYIPLAWYRQLQKLGLSTEYQNQSSKISIWIRHTFGLLFLEPTEVNAECFVEDFMLNRPIDERVEKYSDYLLGRELH